MGLKRGLSAVSVLLIFVFVTGCSPNSKEVEAEFEKILKGLSEKAGRVPMEEFLSLAEERLGGFIEDYEGTTESAEAHLTLAKLNLQAGNSEEGIDHIKGYLQSDVAKDSERENAVKVALGRVYMNLGRLGQAEAVYSGLMKADDLGQETRASVSRELEKIPRLRKLKIGKQALDFSATTLKGNDISLDDLEGKVVLLDFWATWCKPCRVEMPNVKEAYSRYHNEGFEIVGVSLDEDRKQLKEYLKGHDVKWPQIYDGEGWGNKVARLYAVSGIPTTFLLDQKGIIRYKNIRGDELKEAVKELLEGQAQETPS